MIRQSQWSLTPRQRPTPRPKTPTEDETTSQVIRPSTASTSPSSTPSAHPRDTADLFAPASAAAQPALATATVAPPSPPTTSFPPRPRAVTETVRAPARRRTEVRKPLHIGVELLRRGHDNPEFAIGADLSPSGALVFSDAALDPSDYVVLRFRLPWSDDRYAFLSEVVRVQPAPEEETGALFGFGLRFLDVSPSERLGLRQELQDLPPAVPWVPQAN